MSSSLERFGLDRLTVEERLQLVGDLWDSIAESAELTALPEWQTELLDRRLAALEADPTVGSSWEEVKERLRARRRGQPS
jgi:putative addiction module component (TIGR02574 family)